MSLFAGVSALPAPNDPLVSSDDYTEWMGLGPAASLPASQQAQIQTALEIASAEIRNGRRVFSPVTGTVEAIDGHNAQSVLTSRYHLPVTAVTLVEEFNGSTYTTVDATDYQWTPSGVIERLNWRCWPGYLAGVRVTYNHGYDILPRDVAGVCLRLAARLLANPGGSAVLRETLGDASVEYSNAATGGLLPEEETVLSLYESNRA